MLKTILTAGLVALAALAATTGAFATPKCGQYGCIYPQGNGVEQWRGHDGLRTTSYPNGTYQSSWGQTRQWKENQGLRRSKPYASPPDNPRYGPEGCTRVTGQASGNSKRWNQTCFTR